MKNMQHFVIASFLLVFVLPITLQANGRHFTYTFQTHVQKPGSQEIEVWNTYRSERVDFYRQIDSRIEFLFGVVNHLESALYLNNTVITQQVGDALVSSQSMSVSNKWQYQFLNPENDPVGLGLLGEITLGTHETKVEGKLLLDKNIGHVLVALNAVYEQEWKSEIEHGHVENEALTIAEFDMGLAYLFSHHFSVGIEVS